MKNRCKFCGAHVFWSVTSHNTRLPMNGEPDPYGTYYVWQVGVGEWHSIRNTESDPKVAAAKRERRPLYKPHYATCRSKQPRGSRP